MAAHIQPEQCRLPGYEGLDQIFEFTNHDGTRVRTNCGQAASATLLTHLARVRFVPEKATEIMAKIEAEYPPNLFFGWFGTGRRQVQRICAAHGVDLAEIRGVAGLRENLAKRRPVVVMLGVSAGKFLKFFDLPGGHWMVAYGFDAEHVYLTNWGRMSWAEFERGWRALVPRTIGMHLRGLVACA